MDDRPGVVLPPAQCGFGAALNSALTSRGMSLLGLQRRLADRGHHVSAGTLSYWRSGKRRPEKPTSLDAVREIEDLLGLDAGALSALIGPSRRPGPAPPRVAPGSSAPPAVGVPDALRELGLGDVGRDMQEVAVAVTVDVDAERQITGQSVRTLLRATTTGAQRWYHVVFAERPVPEPLVLDQGFGVRVGRACTRAEVGLFLWELVLPRPLVVGERVMIETRTRLGSLGHQDRSYFHHLDRRVPDTVVWVRFDPRASAARCVRTIQPLRGPAAETRVDLTGLHSAHLAVRSFGPGRVGLTWEW